MAFKLPRLYIDSAVLIHQLDYEALLATIYTTQSLQFQVINYAYSKMGVKIRFMHAWLGGPLERAAAPSSYLSTLFQPYITSEEGLRFMRIIAALDVDYRIANSELTCSSKI